MWAAQCCIELDPDILPAHNLEPGRGGAHARPGRRLPHHHAGPCPGLRHLTVQLETGVTVNCPQLFESLWVYAGMESFYNTDLETFAMAEKTGRLGKRAYRNLGRNQAKQTQHS